MDNGKGEKRPPGTYWFWDDWFGSVDVQMSSLSAQGLWFNMLGIMQMAKPCGTLSINGKQMDGKMLAKFTRQEERVINELLTELENNGVYSKLSDGTIINRRLYREGQLSIKRAKSGLKGAHKKWNINGKCDGKTMANVYGKDMANVGKDRLGKVKIDKDSWIGIEEKDKENWKSAYPACEIEIELKRMIEWIKANPAKGKKSNYRRFIVNWLSRTQDKGGTKGALEKPRKSLEELRRLADEEKESLRNVTPED